MSKSTEIRDSITKCAFGGTKELIPICGVLFALNQRIDELESTARPAPRRDPAILKQKYVAIRKGFYNPADAVFAVGVLDSLIRENEAAIHSKYCNDPDHCTYSDCPTAFCDKNKL